MNILVVDDEEMVRCVLTDKLGECGFSVTTAIDGQNALEIFDKSTFGAVLLDLKMPGMDGIETLKELKKLDPDTPVIMVTAFGDIATAVEAIKLGAYDFVEKPPQISRIIVTLKHAIEWAALEREVKDLGKNVEESAAMKQTYEKLRELDQVKSAFLSSVSHELRTPLTSIKGFSEMSRAKLAKLISENGVDPKTVKQLKQLEDNLEIIVSESERLGGLIEGILDLTAIEAGTAEWRWEPVSLREIIEDTATAFSPVFMEKGLEFVVTIEGDLPLIMGDRHRISQVIKQLFSNAVAFTGQGRVRCVAKNIDNHIVLNIDDTGKGIPTSQHGMIFEKFSQIGDALTGKPKGVGLGLPICKMIVEYHGGQLTVASEPGKGSVFTVSLPCSEEADI